ncbi:hypothetical protein [Microbaculum sp. FT89]|uniref:hypothetical protein n=1 Tax=Microbaculum sp. FT89 TaxID=3447298 RepID=UPI003F5363B3
MTRERNAMSARPWWAWLAGGIAVAFGIATILSGGRVLFGGEAARTSAGAYVDFVLWFNFAAGFAYVIAGAGLLLWRRWAARLSLAIAAATVAVAIAFTVHVLGGGDFEMRTVGAMVLRGAVWIAIAALACRALGCLRLSGRP